MMSQASRAGDMPSDIKLRYCTKIADECLLRKLSKQARHAHAFQPITATAHSNHSSSDTGKQPAQKEYYNGLEVCRNFCRGQCKSSNCKFSHPPGRGRSASYTAAGQKVDAYLQGDRPAAVLFPKHQSVNTYKDFVQAEVARGLHKGVIARWPFKQPPTVVNGLRVVDDKLPKLRLCINPMYVNFFMRFPAGQLTSTYLFSPLTAHRNGFSDAPMKATSIGHRLNKHLESAGLYAGESDHGFRRGQIQDLVAIAVPKMQIGEAVQIKTTSVLEKYADARHIPRLQRLGKRKASQTQAMQGLLVR
ncbi:hypothetical protein WJX77_004908 [Trebouxia sp. C0004]